ncbi:MAG: aminoacyl-tRNA hydrolase [Sedimentisphaerales bacterium]|nr:aminoacyl-tRNA hydrolase [Sedimentisphaerales bacterium]
MIQLGNGIVIEERWLSFAFSRSSGPGGQNVNKVNTRVTVLLDLEACPVFTNSQKSRIRRRLSTRIDGRDQLMVSSQKFRTQRANRNAALDRLTELLNEALKKRAPRKKTRPSRSAIERRLQDKKHRGQIKQSRSYPGKE